MSEQEEIEQLRQQVATQEDTIKALWVEREFLNGRIEKLQSMYDHSQAYIAKLKAGQAKAGVQDIMQEVFGNG